MGGGPTCGGQGMQLLQLPSNVGDVAGIGHVLRLEGFGHKKLLDPPIRKSPKHLHGPDKVMHGQFSRWIRLCITDVKLPANGTGIACN